MAGKKKKAKGTDDKDMDDKMKKEMDEQIQMQSFGSR